MKLYHGTNYSSAINICQQGIDLSKSLPYLDFGKGFYTTEDKAKAAKRAIKKTADLNRRRGTNEAPWIVEITVDESVLSKLKVKEFDSPNIDWCEFVTNNRFDTSFLKQNNIKNHNKDNKFDVVCGEIADGSISSIVLDVKLGKMDLEQIDYSQYFPQNGRSFGQQVSFHTKKSLTCITNISCAIIPYEERNKSYRMRKR